MRSSRPLLALLVALTGCAAAGEPVFLYDAPSRDLGSDVVLEGNRYDPAVVELGDATWLAWLEYDPQAGDTLWIGRREGGTWADRRALVAPATRARLARPTWTTTTHDSTTYTWLTWEQRTEVHWQLAWAVFGSDGREIARDVIEAPGINVTEHATSAVGAGPVLLVARLEGPKQSRIALTALGTDPTRRSARAPAAVDGIPTAPRWKTVRATASRPWAPDVAGGPELGLVVWDEYDGSSFQVRARTLRDGALGPVLAITDSDRFEGRASAAFSRDSKTFWVAWEEGERGWGARYVGNDMAWNNSTDDRGSLHRFRRVRFSRLGPDGGRIETPPLDLPSYGNVGELGARRDDVHDMGMYYERPEVVVDGVGRPWVVYRHFAQAQLGRPETTHHHIESGWRLYARALGSESWSPLYRLQHDQRDGQQRLTLAPTADGIVAAWTTGRTDRREDDRPRGVALARIARAGDGPPPPAGGADVPPTAALPERRPAPPALDAGGTRWHLVFGDLHRHTDLSLCFAFFDGSLDDAYRYARSVEGLDFLGITDHTRDIDQGDVQSLLWWRATKEVTRHHAPGVFHPFYSFERSHDDTDHNVISLRDDMLRNFPPPLPEFWAEIDDDQTITIPHTTHTVPDEPFNGTVWDYQDDQRRPLAEVYQGFRDVSALQELQVPLGKGYHLGMIASSDHLSTGASYAAAWTDELDRDSVFDALRSRRTYGATDRIRLVFRSGDHWMGEIVRTNESVPLEIDVTGTAPLDVVELWVDGAKRETFTPKAKSVTLRARSRLQPENHYAFVRVVQKDGNRAWSSPIWLEPSEGPDSSGSPRAADRDRHRGRTADEERIP